MTIRPRLCRLAALVSCAGAAAAGFATGPVTASAAALANPAPAVVPSLHQWSGGTGVFALARNSHIVVNGADWSQLAGEASTLHDELTAVTGLDLPTVIAKRPRAEDVFLTLGATGVGPEGYRLSIGETVTVSGGGPAGVFYGGQTLLQMLRLDPYHVSLPRGSANDWPDYRQRGVMLDTARKFYSVAYIERTIKQLAWLKMNTLHLHLADSNAWRLQSSTYPGLTAQQHYSKDQLRQIQDLARQYHVQIQPEFDLPGHADELTSYNPALRWPCASMNNTPYGPDNGFTVDITKPDNVAWVDRLIKEYLPLFDSPVIHLGGDEYPTYSQQQNCPYLVDYARTHGFASTEDVFIAYQNHLDQLVKSFGKTLMLWDWWEVAGGATTAVNKDVVIQAWNGDPDPFADAGYQTVGSRNTTQYVVPNSPPGGVGFYQPDSVQQYSQWAPSTNPNVQGYQIPAWGDGAAGASDAYFDWFLHRPAQVLAARTWGGPRLSSAYSFEDQVDRVGAAPGVFDTGNPDAVQLTGTPYGNTDDMPGHTYAAAFDTNLDTYVDTAAPDTGHIGIDLGSGNAAPVTEIRFVPRANAPGWNYVNRTIGGTFQGCTDGPASGCHDLASVPWRPTRDWNTLPVTDHTPYRWLRYLSPPSGYANIAEIQFYTAPATAGRVRVTAPDTIQLGQNTVRTTFTNTGTSNLKHVRLSLQAAADSDYRQLPADPLSPPRAGVVQPGKTFTVRWHLTAPAGATGGTYHVRSQASYAAGRPPSRGTVQASDQISVSLPYPSVSAAANNAGVSTDSNQSCANYGSGYSYSTKALAAVGLTSGAPVQADGLIFTWPDVAPCSLDNIAASTQTISVNAPAGASTLGFLGSSTSGASQGTVTLHYTDGSTSTATLSFSDWATGPGNGNVAVAQMPYCNNATGTQLKTTIWVYAATVPVDSTKTLSSVTLPNVPGNYGTTAMHVFAVSARRSASSG